VQQRMPAVAAPRGRAITENSGDPRRLAGVYRDASLGHGGRLAALGAGKGDASIPTTRPHHSRPYATLLMTGRKSVSEPGQRLESRERRLLLPCPDQTRVAESHYDQRGGSFLPPSTAISVLFRLIPRVEVSIQPKKTGIWSVMAMQSCRNSFCRTHRLR